MRGRGGRGREQKRTFPWVGQNLRDKNSIMSLILPRHYHHYLQTLLKKKGGHFRRLAEKAAGDMGMVMEMFERGAKGLLNGGVGGGEENGGQELKMTAIS